MTTILITQVKKIIRSRVLAITLAGMLALPGAAFCQYQDEEGLDDQDQLTEQPVSSGPWENSAGSVIGSSRENTGSNSTSTPSTRPRLGSTLGRGPVTTAGGPGGNPDVPFDSNMNLGFLAAGVVFAFWVARKKLKPAAIAVHNK